MQTGEEYLKTLRQGCEAFLDNTMTKEQHSVVKTMPVVEILKIMQPILEVPGSPVRYENMTLRELMISLLAAFDVLLGQMESQPKEFKSRIDGLI